MEGLALLAMNPLLASYAPSAKCPTQQAPRTVSSAESEDDPELLDM